MAILAGYGQIGPWRPFPGVLRPFWPPRGHIGVKKGSKKGSKMASQEPLWEASGRPFWPYMAPQRPFPWVYYRSPWDPLARGLPEGSPEGSQNGPLGGSIWPNRGQKGVFWPFHAYAGSGRRIAGFEGLEGQKGVQNGLFWPPRPRSGRPFWTPF